jgi:non-specific serine/threonine protein kinase
MLPSLATPTPDLHNLPHQITSFVGRAQELSQVRSILATARLVTLTGAGGVGKTRLGLEVAAGLLAPPAGAAPDPADGDGPAFPDGVWLVELAAIRDAAQVARAVAATLNVRETPERSPTISLVEALLARRVLLILDNCEHLIDACAGLVLTLLRACPDLRILATSREALGVPGEVTFAVPALPVPASASPAGGAADGQDRARARAATAGAAPPPLDLRAQPEAVRLFVERAQSAAPGFGLTVGNLAAVEQVCRRLDGIPLALELAAARIGLLSPSQIARRLDDRFGLLTGRNRTALPRHHTLRALIDWSHNLLDERERILFRRLAVFDGSWSLDATEAICAGDGFEADETLDVLSGLVAKSLVLTIPRAGEVRYGLLESLRVYAADALAEAGETERVRERQCAWVLTLAERAASELHGPHQDLWLDRLDRERDQLRAAQRWAGARGDAETIARLGGALWQFWWARGEAAEAQEWVSTVVPLAQQARPTLPLARALHGAGMLAGSLADYPTCRSLLHEALAAARQLGDQDTLAMVLDGLGRQLSFEGQYAEANRHLAEALAIVRALDDRQALARTLSRFGFLQYLEGDHEAARAALEEGLAVAREAGDAAMIAEILDKLGQMAHSDGDLDGAVRLFEQAAAIWRELGQGHWLAMTLNNLGSSQVLLGELGRARAQLAEAMGLARRRGNRRRMAFTLATVATLAALEGDPARAIRFDTVSVRAVAAMGILRVPARVPLRARIMERANGTLGSAGVEAAVEAGSALPFEQAIDEALTWLASAGQPADLDVQPGTAIAGPARAEPTSPAGPGRPAEPTSPAPADTGTSPLSPRQQEVAALIARGFTNRQIADELIITEGTAANHVKAILAHLGLESRVQVAVWAIERGLHERPAS